MTKITDEHDVVVIGAGAAGIAATRRLIEAGVDVLLQRRVQAPSESSKTKDFLT